MEKTLKILASVFWIVGLTATIVGLNIKTDAGQWICTVGNFTFLVGLRCRAWCGRWHPAKKAPPKRSRKAKIQISLNQTQGTLS